MTDELLRQLDCFDQARRRLEQRRSPQTKQFFTQGYDADLGGYIGIDSQGNRLVLPSISTGSVELGTSALCRSSSIDVMPASVSERPVEDASFLTTNPKIYFTRFLLTETPDEENTNVILGGFPSPIVLESGIPRYLERCPGSGEDPDDLLPDPVCRQVDHERRYILHNRYPWLDNPNRFEQQYFLFIVPAGRCLPRLRPANSSNTFFGTVSYKGTGWMIERGPLKIMSSFEMERPPEVGGGSIIPTFLARGRIWDGSSYRDSANGQIPDTTNDLIGPGGQFVVNSTAPGSYAFFADYRDGVEEFPGMLVFGDLVVYEISRTDTGEIFPNPEEEADIPPPAAALRENEIATAMAVQDGNTYVHIAHTPSCNGPQYEIEKSWILDPEGNFIGANGEILQEFGAIGVPPQAFPPPEVAETLYRIELFSDLPPVEPVNEPVCEADFKGGLSVSLNRKGDAIAISSDILLKNDNDLTQPETRFGPGFNAPNFINGIRFNDPSRQLLKPEFTVSIAELELSEVGGNCRTKVRDTRAIIVPGLNINQPQPDTDWPHNGWGFHWLLTGCYQKR